MAPCEREDNAAYRAFEHRRFFALAW